ncbi:hypothetical protein TWF128_003663 [Orbilia oligospora]|nr:hypothetical protein TWF128_003663 [Orbilia oligospora]
MVRPTSKNPELGKYNPVTALHNVPDVKWRSQLIKLLGVYLKMIMKQRWPRNGRIYSTNGIFSSRNGYSVFAWKLRISRKKLQWQQRRALDSTIFKRRPISRPWSSSISNWDLNSMLPGAWSNDQLRTILCLISRGILGGQIKFRRPQRSKYNLRSTQNRSRNRCRRRTN